MEPGNLKKLKAIIKGVRNKDGISDKITDDDIESAWEKVPSINIRVANNILDPIGRALENIDNYSSPWLEKIAKDIYGRWHDSYRKLKSGERDKKLDDAKPLHSEPVITEKKPRITEDSAGIPLINKDVETVEMGKDEKSDNHLKEEDKASTKTSARPQVTPSSTTIVGPEPSRHLLKNGMVGKEYHDRIIINHEVDDCSVGGIDEEKGYNLGSDEIGLTIDKKTLEIRGTPKRAGNYGIVIRYKTPTGKFVKKSFSLLVNPDPRSLWKVLEPEDTSDYKKHEDCLLIDAGDRKIVAASKRGRSHAHSGKYRDDDFKIDYLGSGWSIIAVADGAGSAELSRVGSRLACDAAVEEIGKNLENLDIDKFSLSLKSYKENGEDKHIRSMLYNVIGSAAFEARKSITEEAKKREIVPDKGTPEDLFATTLLLAIHRKFDTGHFIAGFWVGDGGLGIYKENEWVKLLGVPDSGEFGGQTRFLTTPNIVENSKELSDRIKFCLIDDFTALLVMSDGVTDPRFETDSKLSEIKYWDELWGEFIGLLSNKNEPEKELLCWLDFWSPGNHDDRTIAILF